MRKNIRLKLWSFFWVAMVVFLFVLFSYFIQTKLEFFEGMIIDGVFGMVAYVFLNVLAVVLAPITVLPLIVLASGLWGPFVAALLTISGWTIGGLIAFVLARRFGVPVIKRIIPLEDVYKFEERINVGSGFWNVLFLRMIIPVDILSYALGLFSKIGFWSYALATLIGVAPVTFLFAYLGEVPYIYQIVFGLVFLICLLVFGIFREVFSKN